ncbi:DUF4123 domain-containing protein, partial [Pseudomonas agarici]|uniref:DUF4123 domain-containing protein n=1 Tax=Pseudomonas agarici TaxID=46677 RepID=UPI00035EB47F
MALMFAYDPPTANATLEVQTWMQSEPPAPYWALVDVALVGSDRFKATARRHRWTPVNALANTPLQAFGEVAPHLIAISEVPQQRTAQIEQLLRLTAGTPALSWLRSAYPEPALQMLFGYLAKAQVQERPKPVHLRFADTRILPGLLQTLSPTQYRRVLDIVQGWRWFARSGEWQTGPIEPVSVDAAEMDSETHLRLSTEQFDQLLADAEADGVFYRLMLEHPVLVPPQQRAAFHQRL